MSDFSSSNNAERIFFVIANREKKHGNIENVGYRKERSAE